ncbi:MAG: hypothetical protein ACT4N8_06465 [Sphingosinicella sp.]|uniref:hypothetical protein n=1 Tax=Sphingosinicella sp. TaxID=1917971 RepID=UPI0040384295
MAPRPRLSLASPIAAAMLAGCAVDGDFPSLAPRPQERELSIVEPRRAPVAVSSDSGLRLRVLELRRQAADGERAFDAAFPAADRATARAGAPETESWIEAQQALSRLEAARGALTEALAQLDRLATGRADVPTNAEDYAAIHGMIEVVQEIADRQDERMNRLRARLSR